MQTFTEPREFVDNPRYDADRAEFLAELDLGVIDGPIVGIVGGFSRVPHCFTLQSCYGHFVTSHGEDPRNLDALPPEDCGTVRYRIAYIAFCIENSAAGRALRGALERIPAVAPDHIQFCTCDWWWVRYPNTYALQVEPYRYRFLDEARLEYDEALRVQECRALFFARLEEVLREQLLESPPA